MSLQLLRSERHSLKKIISSRRKWQKRQEDKMFRSTDNSYLDVYPGTAWSNDMNETSIKVYLVLKVMTAADEFKDLHATVAVFDAPFPEGWGRTKPGSKKGAPVVRPAGFSSVTPYVVRQVTRLTRSFSASFGSLSLVCSSLDTDREACTNVLTTHSMI